MLSELSYSDQATALKNLTAGEKTRFEAAYKEKSRIEQTQKSKREFLTAAPNLKSANLHNQDKSRQEIDSIIAKEAAAKELPTAAAMAKHKAADKALTESQINDINKSVGLAASEKSLQEGTQKVKEFFQSVNDFFSGKSAQVDFNKDFSANMQPQSWQPTNNILGTQIQISEFESAFI